jgi:hypothetical protein
MDALIVRALAVAEWDAFRNLRLVALKDAPGVFATSYAEAAKRAPETWQSLVKRTHQSDIRLVRWRASRWHHRRVCLAG